jgi:hypothetical protein
VQELRDVSTVAMTYYTAKTKMRRGAERVSSDRGELIEKVKREKGKEAKETKSESSAFNVSASN